MNNEVHSCIQKFKLKRKLYVIHNYRDNHLPGEYINLVKNISRQPSSF